MTALAVLHKDDIIRHLEQGKTLAELNLGISPQAISKALKDDPDYNDAMVEYHASRLDLAERMILDAIDQVDVARARALHSAYSWRASKEQRRVWGDDPAIVINTGITIDAAINSSAQALLDKLKTVAIQDQNQGDRPTI